MAPFIDVHCHLDYPGLIEDIDAIMERAKNAEVNIIISNGIDQKSNRNILQLIKKYPIIKAALGLYPPEKELSESILNEELKFIEKNKKNIIAIGEIGLDYKNCEDKENQHHIFISQLKLSKKLDKPVIIHSRKAEEDVLNILREKDQKKVVLHCFGGKRKLVVEGSKRGYYFSIPTNVVRSEQIQAIIKTVPLNQLFAETDSPFLSPFREQRNEPSFVVESYKKIAEIKGVMVEEVKNNLYMNYQRLFC